MTLAKDSIYDLINPPKTVMKQHFVDYFQNSDFPSYVWSTWNETGSAIFTMDNGANSGLKVTTAAGGRSGIDFNNTRQFSHNSSTIIAVAKKTALSSRRLFVGFRYDGTTNGTAECALLHSHDGGNIGLLTGDASGGDTTAGSVAPSTNYILTKIVLKNSSCDMNINGILDVTRTEDLPTVATQPQLMARDDASGTCIVHCTYMEAYNN